MTMKTIRQGVRSDRHLSITIISITIKINATPRMKALAKYTHWGGEETREGEGPS